jgi:predicted transcriptional regulator
MQHLAAISELKSRAERIGWSLGRLATKAGVAPSTAYRGLNGKHDTGGRKIRAMLAALEEEERRVAQHLLDVGAGDQEHAA